MRNLQENFRELTYPELLKMNGGYGGSSGGGSRGYSGTSGGGNPCSSRTNASAIPVGRTSFVRRDEDTLTTSRKNSDGSETVTTVNTKTGAVISSYTTGIRKGGSKANSTTGGGSYSTSSSGWNGGGYPGSSSGSGSGRSSGHGYSGTSSGSSSGTNTGNSQPKNTTTEATTLGNNSSGFKHQVCADPKQVHCDIIAWNHAVDAGLNPAGKGNDSWDGNKLTVDAIFNNYYADEAVEFNADLAGKKGYIFYDWTGDGTFDHVEYCEIDNNGTGYSFYNNQGYEKDEKHYHRFFADDNNAGARPDGNGRLKFIALN